MRGPRSRARQPGPDRGRLRGCRLPGATAEGGSITGTHEQIAERLLDYRDAGVAHLQVVTAPAGPAGAEGMARVLELVGQRDAA